MDVMVEVCWEEENVREVYMEWWWGVATNFLYSGIVEVGSTVSGNKRECWGVGEASKRVRKVIGSLWSEGKYQGVPGASGKGGN